MAGPPNEYRTLKSINTFLLRGAGFSIAAKTRKKTTRRKKTRKKKQREGSALFGFMVERLHLTYTL